MESWKDFFKGKKITVMGMGLLGGVEDIRFLAEQGAELIVTDLKSEEALRSSLEALAGFSNIRYTLGEHRLEDFRDRDLIIKAPATPPDSPYIAEARKQRIPVTMWAALFSRFARAMGATIVGVTGTRGKTTTTAMIVEGLHFASRRVLVGGNMPGSSILSQLPEVTPEIVVVLELDSWKLQGFDEEKMSPDVGVFTTFYPDHLNYYHGDLDAYLEDKATVFRYQRPQDTLVLGEQCAALLQEKYGAAIGSKQVIARAQDVPSDLLSVPGEHNRANAACAHAALRALGVSDDAAKKALAAFRGVEGRMQFVRTVDGVKIYNDTTATTPEATIAALCALDPEGRKNVVLIMGGADKDLDLSALMRELPLHCKKVVLLSGTGTVRWRTQLLDAEVFDSLGAALAAARAATAPGDILLFSPAFASFGMFKNEYDRGAQFLTLIGGLK